MGMCTKTHGARVAAGVGPSGVSYRALGGAPASSFHFSNLLRKTCEATGPLEPLERFLFFQRRFFQAAKFGSAIRTPFLFQKFSNGEPHVQLRL